MNDQATIKRTSVSRDEMNLAEFPLAVLSTRTNPKIKTLEFSDTQRLPNGEVLERKWILTGADKFGLPTATDDDVVLGLICLTMDRGFRSRRVHFTRYELLKVLRWTTEGRSYQRLSRSLDRLSGVRIRASNSFYDNVSKAYQTKNFGVIDAYEIVGERSYGDKPESYFIWSEAIFESFKAGFIKKIDLDYYFSLKSAVSRRLYRYLDKHFYYKSFVEKPLMTLAFEKLGLSRSYKYVSSIKQQIEPACEELQKQGFLADYAFIGSGKNCSLRMVKSSGSAQTNVMERAIDYKRADGSDQPESAADQRTEAISRGLRSRGLTAGQVRNLLQGKSAAELSKIEEIISYYDSLMRRDDKRISRSPVGFLYRAVEDPSKFSLPGAPSASTPTRRSKRPEHRVVRASKTSKSPDDAARRRYRLYLDREILTRQASISSAEKARIRRLAESKLACVRDVLEEKRYQEALESAVKKELAEALGLPSFEEWPDRESSFH